MKFRPVVLLILLASLTATRGLSQDATSTVDKALQSELLQMMEGDQKLRGELHERMTKKPASGEDAAWQKEFKELWDQQEAIDRKNMARLEEIIKEHGWPGKSLVGEKAAGAAFLILQHAEPEVLKKYFSLLKEAAAKGEAQPRHAAMMEDRLLMQEGKNQIYGTQLQTTADGKLKLYPIEDEEHVDARRAAVGLPPLAEYVKGFGLEYKPPKKE